MKQLAPLVVRRVNHLELGNSMSDRELFNVLNRDMNHGLDDEHRVGIDRLCS